MTGSDDELTLFDVEPFRFAAESVPAAKLSPDARRTRRQYLDVQAGIHPLTRRRLHPEAAPGDDPDAPGRRCGNCRFRVTVAAHSRAYPKCYFGHSGTSGEAPPRYSNSAASDVRAWWPACSDHQPRDPNQRKGDIPS